MIARDRVHHPVPPTPRRASGATYRRRRRVLSGLIAFAAVSGAMVAHDVLVPSASVPASAAGGGPVPIVRTVVARPGDSLWGLAREYRGDTPMAEYVDLLVELNGGASIDAGQLVLVP